MNNRLMFALVINYHIYMPQPNYTPVSVIGSQFMAAYPFDIIVDTNSGGNIVISDINYRIMLKVKPCDTTFHQQRMLLHPDGTPVLRLRDKIISQHNRWEAFRGDSKSSSNMIFSAKQSRIIQFKTSLQVFLANKKSGSGKDVCDFKIKGSWSKRTCKIYTGDSDSGIIAQVHKMEKSKKKKFDKKKFMVTIYPNVDYAFVVALIAIIDAMKSRDKENAVKMTEAASQVAVAIATS